MIGTAVNSYFGRIHVIKVVHSHCRINCGIIMTAQFDYKTATVANRSVRNRPVVSGKVSLGEAATLTPLCS